MQKTFQSLLVKSATILKDASIESYMIDTRIIICFTLNISLEKLIGYPETAIEQSDFDAVLKNISLRASRMPISHIIGSREFCGLNFQVTQHTLDPRADSETIVELVHETFKDKTKPYKIVDIGTGTGCLLLSLLKTFPNSTGVGIDISNEALEVAKNNANKLGLAKHAKFMLNDLLRGLDRKFDIVISNPPYIKTCEIASLQPEVSKFEPNLALDGGKDGLKCYVEIAKNINNITTKDSIVFFEFGIGQEFEVQKIFEEQGFKLLAFKKDLSAITRCISLTKI